MEISCRIEIEERCYSYNFLFNEHAPHVRSRNRRLYEVIVSDVQTNNVGCHEVIGRCPRLQGLPVLAVDLSGR